MGVSNKPEKEEPVFRLLCVTTDSECYAEYAAIEITASQAQKWLHHFRFLYNEAKKHDANLYCLQFWDSINWGNTVEGVDVIDDGDISSGEWFLAADGVEVTGGEYDEASIIKADVRVADETLKVTDTGILWSASPKHGNGYFETPELTWQVLEQIGTGQMPLQTIEKTDKDDTDVDDNA